MQIYHDNRIFPLSQGRKNTIFWLVVISLAASLPYFWGYDIVGAEVPYRLPWTDQSYRIYGIVSNVAAAGSSYVCFSRIFRRQKIGIICSALYTLSVFRLYKLYVAGDVGESAALAFIPLVLYGLYRIFTEDPEGETYGTAWVPFALGITGAAQSHALSGGLTGAAVLFFCVVYVRKLFSGRVALELLKGILSSLLVNLWRLVSCVRYYLTPGEPAPAQAIQGKGLYFAQLAFHFWTVDSDGAEGSSGMRHCAPVGVGLILTAALGIFLILWFSGKLREPDAGEGRFVKAAAVSGSLCLFMSMNIFPWDRIRALNTGAALFVGRLEFPDRFLGWGTVCLVLVSGYCLWYFERGGKRFCYGLMAGAAVAGIATSGMYLLDHVDNGRDSFGAYHEEGRGADPLPGSDMQLRGTGGDA